MKTFLALCLVFGLTAVNLSAQTADQLVAEGRALWEAQDLPGANAKFAAAVSNSPTHAVANGLLATTRVLLIPRQPALSNYLNRVGLTNAGRDLLNWTADFLRDTNGEPRFTNTLNSSEAIALFRTNVMPALAASRTNLARITDPNFLLTLTALETGTESVTVDYGDVQLLHALLYGGEFGGLTVNAHNCSVVINRLQTLARTNGLTMQQLLVEYPSLLLLANAADLAASRAAFTNGANWYQSASGFIRTNRATNVIRLFNLDPLEVVEEQNFREGLALAVASLGSPQALNPNQDPTNPYDDPFLNLAPYFTGAKTLRSLLPKFAGNRYLYNSLPDHTFGGILTNYARCEVEAELRRLLPTFAGLYQGDMGGLVEFGMIVRTNHQVSLVGPVLGGGGVSFEFTLDDDGYWEFETNVVRLINDSEYETNSVYSWGEVLSDGTLFGDIIIDSVGWLPVTGFRLADLGDYQTAAGFYTGTWTGGGATGRLRGVLGAEGTFIFAEIDADNVVADGGLDFFTGLPGTLNTFSTQGTEIAARLSGTTISGNFTNDGTGTFTMSRTAFVPFETPPVTGIVPLNRTNAVASAVTFTSSATGTAPLCYQWFFNGLPIPGATSSSLTRSALRFEDEGVYSVEIRNLAGGAIEESYLKIIPETVRPTITITSPTANLRWSNALFTARGTAADNAQVTGVQYQFNNGAWTSATGTTNWQVPLNLIPGTNVFRAYAVDVCTNLSLTNSVSFVYVLSAPLQVATTGRGSISPNYSNAVLEIGRSYSMTATPVLGYAFTNWTGSKTTNNATLQFVMASNLSFTANFVDTQKPTLAITNPLTGTRISNALATVRGNATDNTAVSAVWFQLNNQPWGTATGTSNWLAPVTLSPGTNFARAYSVDTAGNLSPTSSVSLIYVVSGVLQVGTTGKGTLSPNYSNAVLEIGRGYSMTATPATGFVFTNWTGSKTTNNATLQFVMASNLTFTANFVDIQKPTLAVTAPLTGSSSSNALAALRGTAADNDRILSVLCRVNSNDWATATGTTNWSFNAPLAKGTNVLRVIALDPTGNVSATNTLNVISSNAFVLKLNVKPPSTGTGGLLEVEIEAAPNLRGSLQGSSNLTVWAPVTNFFANSNVIRYRETPGTNGPVRFYRAVAP